jgi:hypothetical protein
MRSRRLPAYICASLFLFLFADLSLVSAQTYTFGQGNIGVGGQPASIAAGDFNGDGKLDLLVANLDDSTVSVLLGKPDGTFGSPTSYATGPAPTSVITGDFNGDGNLDIAVANENCAYATHVGGFGCGGAGSISILLGNGDGTFQAHVDFVTLARIQSVRATDLNGDGKLDLVVANNLSAALSGSQNSFSVLLGNGDGTFQTRVDYAPPGSEIDYFQTSAWAVVGDFNGDGKPDVAINFAQRPPDTLANAVGSIAIYLGNGDGTLQSPLTFAVPLGFGQNSWATVGDFNGDGRQDLAFTAANGLNVFLSNGDGTFTPTAVPSSGGDGTIITADVNKDGKLDLLVGVTEGGAVTVLLGNGDGTFQFATSLATGIWLTGIVVGDVNGDGQADIVVTVVNAPNPLPQCCNPPGIIPGSVMVFLGEGNAAFGGSSFTSNAGVANSLPIAITTADFNGDGKLDLAFVNSGQTGSSLDNTVSVLLGKGDGTFQPQMTFATGVLPADLQVGDFNADGKVDLAVANEICAPGAASCGAGSVSVLLGNGDGTFRPHIDTTVGVTPLQLAVADFNGDGKSDIAVVNNGLGHGNTFSTLIGNGDGTFASPASTTLAGPPTAIVATDMNHDGKADVVVSTLDPNPQSPVYEPPFLSVFLGKGDGTFQPPINLQTGAAPDGAGQLLVAGDVDGDGNMDLMGAHVESAGITTFFGKGDGSIAGTADTGNLVTTGFFALGDFDGDGKPDLAVAEQSSNLGIYFNNGFGQFQRIFLPGVQAFLPIEEFVVPMGLTLNDRVVAVGDFNGDGALDVAALQPFGNVVTIYLNDAFKGVYPSSLAFGSQGLATNSTAQNITISNPSAAPFQIGNIAVSGGFTETNNCGAKILPKESCTISVQFAPTAEGVSNGAITLTDSTHASPQMIPLTGSGVNGPSLQLSQRHVSFASTSEGIASAPQLVTLSNTGNASFTITNISLGGGAAADFSESSTCGSGLAPGATCSVSLIFLPTAAGTRVANLTIVDSAPGSPHVVNLSGISVGQQASVSPTTLTFGGQVTGTTSPSQSVTLSNTGTSTLGVLQMSTTGDFAQTNNCGTTLGAGNTCQISVTFTPTAGGNQTGSLSIVDGSSGSSQMVTLVGTGQDFSLAASGSASATVMPGQTATYTIALTPGGGLNPIVTLTCGGAPAMATCSISPATVTLSGTTAATATVTVTTTAASQVFLPGGTDAFRRMGRPPMVLAAWLVTALALFSLYRARGNQRFRWAPAAAMALLVFTGLGLASCGGGNSSGGGGGGTGTEAGTYTITVSASATAGSTTLNHATKLTLVVQ